jgi:Protein of unknown function (DUF3788)
VALSIFDDRAKQPEDADLARVLKRSFVFWNELKTRIASKFTPLSIEWGFAGKAYGWSLRLKHKKRTVLYMTPCEGHFLASFALGEKAVNAAHHSDLPTSVLQVIDTAKKYAEGRGVRLEVRNAKDVRHVETLAVIKMST